MNINEEIICKVKNLIQKRGANYEYFFNKLQSPIWIRPLMEAGFFKDPPKPIYEDRYVVFPIWPESRYLVRMARLGLETSLQKLILDIILDIDTENVRVHEDFIDIALSLSPDLSVKLVDKAKEWLKNPHQLLLLSKIGDFIVHLAEGGQIDRAFDLAQVLFVEILRSKPHLSFGLYEDLVKKCLPSLARANGIRTLSLFCNLLEKVIQASYEGQSPNDFSYIWRPAIEDHERNLINDLENVLVSAVRDTAEIIVRDNPSQIREIIQYLETRSWYVFHRIALYLLSHFPDAAPELIRERLLNEDLFYKVTLWHEYSMLLKTWFSRLDPSERNTILSWIEAGPRRSGNGKDAERKRHIWQRNRLSIIKDHLPERWRQLYEELVKDLGEPTHPEFPVYTSFFAGPISPKSADELQAMSVDELVEFLKNWEPPGESPEPSIEGLAGELIKIVAENPHRYASEALKFKGLDPIYVRSFLFGLRSAVRNGKKFPWEPVIELCKWVVQQPREISKRRVKDRFADPDWSWTWKEIADLLEAGFEKGDSEIPHELKDKVWEIILPLTEDLDPTPEREEEWSADMGYPTISINTVRGAAMHAVVQYALWCRRFIETLPDGEQQLEQGFEVFPEVREVLDQHLNEFSPTIRSVYGRWFPWLVLLDRKWAQANVSRIFPAEENQKHLRDAAWRAYITFCPAYEEVFDILKEEYHRAVEEIGSDDTELGLENDKRLAEHLMTLYWRGKIGLHDELLERFWEKAGDDLSGYAIQFIGMNLRRTPREIQEEILERLKQLWESRLETVRSSEELGRKLKQITAFGWWFVSGKFDDRWALEQLRKALEVARWVEPDYSVIDRLTKLATTAPKFVIECLAILIREDRRGWVVVANKDAIRQILSSLLSIDDPEIKDSAESLVHELGARGYFDFRDLLDEL